MVVHYALTLYIIHPKSSLLSCKYVKVYGDKELLDLFLFFLPLKNEKLEGRNPVPVPVHVPSIIGIQQSRHYSSADTEYRYRQNVPGRKP